jgi:hypothetical protein
MARFYRTASPRPIDYMYRLNVPLMQDVITANDSYITEQLGIAGKLGELASFDHLLNDDQDAIGITKAYEEKVKAVTEAIRKDPANWRKQQGSIDNIKTELINDYKTGPISKMMYNYGTRKKWIDEIDQKVKSGKISEDRAAAYKQFYDKQFNKTGYDPATGKFNQYSTGPVMEDMDIRKVLSEGLDKLKADGLDTYWEDEAGNGWYFNKVTNQREAVTPEKVLAAAMGRVDPKLLSYLQNEQKVGLINGVYDEKGKFKMPFSVGKAPLSEEEQAKIDSIQRELNREKNPKIKEGLQQTLNQLQAQFNSREQLNWDDSTPLSQMLRGITSEYSWSKTKQGNDLSNNSRGSTMFNAQQTWARQTRQLDQQKQIADANRASAEQRAKDRLEWDKYKWEHPQAKSGTGTKTKAPESPVNTQVSRFTTNSFEGKYTKDRNGLDVPLYSVNGLTAEIDRTKEDISAKRNELKTLEEILKDPTNPEYTKAVLRKSTLQQELALNETQLEDRRNVYTAARTTAMDALTPEEKQFFEQNIKGTSEANEEANIDKLRNVYHNLKKQYPPDVSNQNYQENSQVLEARNRLDQAIKVRKKLTQATENKLAEFRTEYIDADAVKPNAQDSEVASQLILSNTSGMQLFDSKGRPTSKSIGELDTPGWFTKDLTMAFSNV